MQKLVASIASRLVIAVPYLWLLVFFLVPFFIVFKISLSEVAMAIPAYMPTFDLAQGFAATWEKIKQLSFDNYLWLLDDPLYYKAYLSSVRIAAISTVLTLLVAYPMAYGIARAPTTIRPTLLMLVILPFWTSFLIRVYAWIGILKPEGLLNQFLMWLNIIDTPLTILNTDTAIFIGIVYSYLPFMVLPIYSSLERWIIRSLKRRRIWVARRSPLSGRSHSRCRWPGCWLVASSCSFRPWVSSSFRTSSAGRKP